MSMNLSDKYFLDKVEDYTSGSSSKKNDLKKIIEMVVAKEKKNIFEKLIFTAKYICGMMRVVKECPRNPRSKQLRSN